MNPNRCHPHFSFQTQRITITPNPSSYPASWVAATLTSLLLRHCDIDVSVTSTMEITRPTLISKGSTTDLGQLNVVWTFMAGELNGAPCWVSERSALILFRTSQGAWTIATDVDGSSALAVSCTLALHPNTVRAGEWGERIRGTHPGSYHCACVRLQTSDPLVCNTYPQCFERVPVHGYAPSPT